MRFCVAALCAAVLLLGTQTSHAAGPYDPDVPYFTLTTPSFLVMYPEGYGHIALRTAHLAEAMRPGMVERYGWDPDGRISIVINDQTDFANGSATILPSKIITLFVSAPTRVSGLEEYDDWITTVLIHEMAHIFHLDMTFGLPWIARLFLGKYISMSAYTPGWVTEGLAVYEETVSTGTGRGRASYVDMVVRTAALQDRFPSIDQGYRGYANWPFTNVAYFFGGRFQLWLAEHYGEEKLMAYHQAYAANPIPYFTYLPAKIVFDTSLESLWLAFEEESTEDAERVRERVQTATIAQTHPQRLTNFGGQSLGPRMTPDGKSIVWSTNSPVDGPRLRKMNLDGSKQSVLLNDVLSEGVSFTPNGESFFLQRSAINQRFYAHNDLFRYDFDTKKFSRVTLHGDEDKKKFLAPSGALRARDPDVAPDAKSIVFVQSPYGANRLVIGTFEPNETKMHPRVLVPAEPDVQFSAPRFSPDGTQIAVSRFAGGRRDIVIYDLHGQILHEVTRDRAQDTDPTWTKDGQYLVFVSDRTGIYNIYAYALKRRELRQLTNLVTGAFQPDVDPSQQFIIYRGYSAQGFDVYRVPFAPEAGLRVPRDLQAPVALDTTERRWPPRRPGAPQVPPPAPFKDTPLPTTLPPDWSIDEYSAADTILPFNDNWNLFPVAYTTEQEWVLALSHFGADARRTHNYFVNTNYGTSTRFLGGSASYTYDALDPTFSISASASPVTYGIQVREPEVSGCRYGAPQSVIITNPDGTTSPTSVCRASRNGLYNERRLRARFGISLPVKQRHFISLAYSFEHRQSLDGLPGTTLSDRALPPSGRFAKVSLGYTYANVRAFSYSISLERGPTFAVALSALSKGLGGDYEQMLLTSEGRYYWDIPWPSKYLSNHVLATRMSVGGGFGPDLAELFRLGGAAGRSAISTTTDNFYALRGFATSRLIGAGVISGTTEYRAPLFRVDRGIGTLPFAFKVVHAALFADYGRVFAVVDRDGLSTGWPGEIGFSVGAELRADMLLFYGGLPLTARIGYAQPILTPDSLPADARAPGPYLRFGTLF